MYPPKIPRIGEVFSSCGTRHGVILLFLCKSIPLDYVVTGPVGFDHSGSVHFVSIPSICASLMLTYFRGAFDMLLQFIFEADTPISFHTATSLRARVCIEGVFHRDSNSKMTREVQT